MNVVKVNGAGLFPCYLYILLETGDTALCQTKFYWSHYSQKIENKLLVSDRDICLTNCI